MINKGSGDFSAVTKNKVIDYYWFKLRLLMLPVGRVAAAGIFVSICNTVAGEPEGEGTVVVGVSDLELSCIDGL